MATVRIYKVAELLGTTSQEVMALLKRDHGIEVKSASSTIEEVVGRQFVERLARQRGVQLPGGDMFAERPAAPGAKKVVPGKKPEPPKPPAPTLGPPRLIKTVRPVRSLRPRRLNTPSSRGTLRRARRRAIEEAAEPVVAEPDVVIAHEPAVVPEPIADSEPQLAVAEPAATVEPVAEPQSASRASPSPPPHRMPRPLLIAQPPAAPAPPDGSCRRRCGCASKRRRPATNPPLTSGTGARPAARPAAPVRPAAPASRVRPLPRPAGPGAPPASVAARPARASTRRTASELPARQVPGGPRPLPSHPVRPHAAARRCAAWRPDGSAASPWHAAATGIAVPAASWRTRTEAAVPAAPEWTATQRPAPRSAASGARNRTGRAAAGYTHASRWPRA